MILPIDKYDKMADYLITNNLQDCERCDAIEMNGDNSCCDDEKWCRKGTAHYLRSHKVLET